MSQQAGVSAGPDGAELTIKELLAYRISRVANAISRSAALRFRREFGVTLGEWRIVALLGSDAPLTLNRLARLAALDKAQMSRAVAKLGDRGLIRREYGAGRSTVLSLTEQGQAVYCGLIRIANERDRLFLDTLTAHELNVLEGALERLAVVTDELERRERELDGGG